jgi:uridine phosphorylase
MKSSWIIHPDGSVYHLRLKPGQVAQTIITVGDPERVSLVSRYFDTIEHKIGSREFITHTGYIGKKHLTVLSTGIGTDNVDIVLNELDALWNLDLETFLPLSQLTRLKIIRMGTSGAIQPTIPIDSFLVSKMAIGLDALGAYYGGFGAGKDNERIDQISLKSLPGSPYLTQGDPKLLDWLNTPEFIHGITLTAPGFYAPQGRDTRAEVRHPFFLETIKTLDLNSLGPITNIEMETAGIYALGASLGHSCISINAILANRSRDTFSQNPEATVSRMIETVLQKITELP